MIIYIYIVHTHTQMQNAKCKMQNVVRLLLIFRRLCVHLSRRATFCCKNPALNGLKQGGRGRIFKAAQGLVCCLLAYRCLSAPVFCPLNGIQNNALNGTFWVGRLILLWTFRGINLNSTPQFIASKTPRALRCAKNKNPFFALCSLHFAIRGKVWLCVAPIPHGTRHTTRRRHVAEFDKHCPPSGYALTNRLNA